MLIDQQWPEELDALVAAPRNHILLFENEILRVLEIRIVPGETTPLHTHRWPGPLLLLSWSDCVRRDADGVVLVDSRTLLRPIEGTAIWSPSMPAHTLENVGTTELRLIGVEYKVYPALAPAM
ncbi:hypothetical protein [Acidipila sp. EB88]|uniref:hypothetical protein n=1 Tax=Acidipila sp. EB88 TaxID=2305226 RepID=UPI000F5E5E45|nr:hypothetical protein [Acidipila sp. EB88]RRA49354.1 hypothetical protein D1Y84_14770 [Acidipila sp. EB88]